jgi:hypothetical protein
VRQIELSNPIGTSEQMLLGDFIETFGVPCSFSSDTFEQKELILYYPFGFITIDLDLHRVSPATPVKVVIISSVKMECDARFPWLGFTSSERYRKYSIHKLN